ncbi:hypothetical protein [Paenibacillus soyae]|uniref:Permuted papain-like amidase enzyme, YaeF/YiiX, C92 family n=1 Tax=Paenibacillus soyae TaxID=2969249 RepID=A0A9X2MKB1_9BACL|nr:hypothetical protein [Paenibacillus soyae]MCR2803473.1 hypothetical protein [Paenibacillus soyae]
MNRDKDIYVLLTDTGTVLTKIIRSFTKDPLNHASIAFDDDLNEVYSFGRKNPSNPFFAGFVRENVRGEFFEDSMCALYRCRVSQATYNSIRAQIQHFEQYSDLYKYNLVGMLGVVFNIEWERRYAYFCSQFVATLFERSGMSLVDKSPLLVTPGDLQTNPQLELVYRGRLHDYTGCEVAAAGSSFRTA